jgi:hypothetical protein
MERRVLDQLRTRAAARSVHLITGAVYGCYGPKETPNTASLAGHFSSRLGVSEPDMVRSFRGFNAWFLSFPKVPSMTHDNLLTIHCPRWSKAWRCFSSYKLSGHLPRYGRLLTMIEKSQLHEVH